MNGCTIQLWYNKQRVKKNGNVSLYLQIIGNKESDEIPLKIDWPVDKIDWNKKMLKPRHTDDTDLLTYNAVIERERSKYWEVVMDFIKDDKDFTLAELFKRVNLYGTGHKFIAFMSASIKARQKSPDIEDRIKSDTARAHTTSLNWVKQFAGDSDISITKIDNVWIKKYANYLRPHMCENTVWARIKDVKTYLSYAHKHKIAVNSDYKLYSIKLDDPDPTWLEEDELNRLLTLYRDEYIHPLMKRNLKAFLFACFTGLRISDLKRWSKDWISGDIISFIPEKRRLSAKVPKPLIIPIIPIAREFINELESETFDLPAEQVYNRELKNIAKHKLVKINKNLTSHVARHTFATWLAIDDVPVLVVSKLLGHKSVKTTMVYIHIAERYKAIQMMKLQRRFGLKASSSKSTPMLQ